MRKISLFSGAILVAVLALVMAAAALAVVPYRLLWDQNQAGWTAADGTVYLRSTGSSTWTTKGHIIPCTTNAYDIGSGSFKYRNARLAGSLYSVDAAFTGNVSVSGTLTAGLVSTTGQPEADDTTDLGASDAQWRNLYVANSIYGAGNEYTFPAAGGEFVTTTGTQTLTNKTLTAPTLTTPALGAATATSVNKVALTAPATAATITIADGKTFTVQNALALYGTDDTSFTFPTATGTVATLDATQTFSGKSFSDSVTFTTAGGGIKIKEGANARMGTATLTNGLVTVANTSVTANTRIFVTPRGATFAHQLYCPDPDPGVEFYIYGNDASDSTTTVDWMLVEPSP